MNFIYLAYSRSQFGIERCKIQYFMGHFSRSVGSSRGQSLQITVNVRDQTARTVTLTSHGLKHRALSACGVKTQEPFYMPKFKRFLDGRRFYHRENTVSLMNYIKTAAICHDWELTCNVSISLFSCACRSFSL